MTSKGWKPDSSNYSNCLFVERRNEINERLIMTSKALDGKQKSFIII